MDSFWVLGLAPALLAAGIYLLSQRSRFLARLYSPLSLCICTSLLLAVCLCMGLVRQDTDQSNGFASLRNLKQSALLIASVLLFLTVLGMFTLHRFKTDAKRLSNLIPAGIFVTVISLLFGSHALERHQIVTWANTAPVWTAYNQEGEAKQLPFAVSLNRFQIDYHPPVLYIVNSHNGYILPENRPQYFRLRTMDGSPEEGDLLDCHIRILSYLPQALIFTENGATFAEPFAGDGHVPAVQAEISVSGTDRTDTAWLACGNTLQLPTVFEIDSDRILGMGKRTPSNYRADLTIYEIKNDSGMTRPVTVRPNHPCRVGRYAIYLKSYKEEYGFWDPYVTLEIVKDPWKPITDLGFLLIFIGLAGAWLQNLFFPRKTQIIEQ